MKKAEVIKNLNTLEIPINKEITVQYVRSQYRKLTKKYHPDISPQNNDGEWFIAIKEAADYLTINIEEVNSIIRLSNGTQSPRSNTSQNTNEQRKTTQETSSKRDEKTNRLTIKEIVEQLLNNPCILDGYSRESQEGYFFAVGTNLYYTHGKVIETVYSSGIPIYEVRLKKGWDYTTECFGDIEIEPFYAPLVFQTKLVKIANLVVKRSLFRSIKYFGGPLGWKFWPGGESMMKSFNFDLLEVCYRGSPRSIVSRYQKREPPNRFAEMFNINEKTNCSICGSPLRNGKCSKRCNTLY